MIPLYRSVVRSSLKRFAISQQVNLRKKRLYSLENFRPKLRNNSEMKSLTLELKQIKSNKAGMISAGIALNISKAKDIVTSKNCRLSLMTSNMKKNKKGVGLKSLIKLNIILILNLTMRMERVTSLNLIVLRVQEEIVLKKSKCISDYQSMAIKQLLREKSICPGLSTPSRFTASS